MRRILPVALLCFAAQFAAADKPPSWLAELATRQTPHYDEAPAVVLFRERDVTLHPDGRILTATRYAVKVLTREGEDEAAARVLYRTGAGKVRALRAWMIYPSGKTTAYGKKETVDVPHSKLKFSIAETLMREGFIKDLRQVDVEPSPILRVYLKYGPDGESVIRKITRTSKSSRRVYVKEKELKPVAGGQGIVVLSTSKGVMSGREASKENVGGEVLFTVW